MGVEEAGGGREEQEQEQLIPGLPDEIGMECLVRVPYESHSRMKSVCRGWRSLISHPSFLEHRRKARTADHLVCLVQPSSTITPIPLHLPKDNDMDDIHLHIHNNKQEEERQQQQPLLPNQYGLTIFNATRHTWQQLTPPADSVPMFCHCVALPSSGKLLLLGGWDPTTLDPVPHVYVLDLIAGDGNWRRAAPMSVARSFFACAVVGRSTLYVAGGHDRQKNALRSAEVYDADADEWRTLPPMWEERDESQGLSWPWEGDSGRFWVVSGYSTENQGRFRSDAECYDPETGCWSKVEGVWPFPSRSPRGCVSANSRGGGGGRQSISIPNHECSWWAAGEDQLRRDHGGEIREYRRVEERERWRVVASSTIPLPLPRPEFGSSKCVIDLDGRLLVLGSSGGDGKVGAFILERDGQGKTKWTHVHVPPQFNGFPHSAAHLLL